MKKLILIAALVSTSAHAEFWSGNDLMTRINGETHYERGSALGYIMGVADVTMTIDHCPPTEVTAGQIRDMTVNFMIANPQERHKSADQLIVRVLKAAWPCQARRPSGRTL